MQHVISVLVQNKFGALARIAGLFCGRGYNIDSLTVSPTSDSGISKMTIVTSGDEEVLEQIEKQLTKLIDVIKVTDLTGKNFVERELALIKVTTTTGTRSEIMQITGAFHGKIVNILSNEVIIELSGRAAKIDTFAKIMSEFGIIELVRTGRVAASRESGPTEEY